MSWLSERLSGCAPRSRSREFDVPSPRCRHSTSPSIRRAVASAPMGTIAVADDHGNFVDLVANPGQYEIVSLADVFMPFQNQRGETVVDFLHPRERLDVLAGRMGGWPTIIDTRIPYDTIANLVAGGDVTLDEVDHYFPGVDAHAAQDAVDFQASVPRAA